MIDRLYLGLGIAGVWLASVVGVGWWQHSAGYAEREAEELKQDVADITKINERLDAAIAAVETIKSVYENTINGITTQFQKDIQNANDQRDRDVAAVRAGTLVLRVDSSGQRASSGTASSDPSSPSRCDGQAGTELPRTVTADLLSLANDADAIVRQLTTCQRVLVETIKTCNQR